MKFFSIIFILSILFFSENIFAQEATIKKDSSVSLMKKLQLSVQFYPLPLVVPNIKAGVGLKINNHFRLNFIGAYGKTVRGYDVGKGNESISYKNRLKAEMQLRWTSIKNPYIFVSPYLCYYEAVVTFFQLDPGIGQNDVEQSYPRILSPGVLVGVNSASLNRLGFEFYTGLGYKFQVGEGYSYSYDDAHTFQRGISARAEIAVYFNFYKGRKNKFNINELLD